MEQVPTSGPISYEHSGTWLRDTKKWLLQVPWCKTWWLCMGQLLLEGSGGMCSHHKTSGTHLLLPGYLDQLNEAGFFWFLFWVFCCCGCFNA